MLGYLTWRAHTIFVQKKSSSVHKSLMMEALSWWVTMSYARYLALTTSVWGYLMDMFEPYQKCVTFQISERIGSFGSSMVQVFRCIWRYQSYRGLSDDSQRRTNDKFVQDNWKHYCWWHFSSNGERGSYKSLAHASWTYEWVRSSSLAQQRCSIKYQILQT